MRKEAATGPRVRRKQRLARRIFLLAAGHCSRWAQSDVSRSCSRGGKGRWGLCVQGPARGRCARAPAQLIIRMAGERVRGSTGGLWRVRAALRVANGAVHFWCPATAPRTEAARGGSSCGCDATPRHTAACCPTRVGAMDGSGKPRHVGRYTGTMSAYPQTCHGVHEPGPRHRQYTSSALQ